MLEFTAFGKNDIRGIYGKDITEELFYYTGRGFVSYLANNLNKNLHEIWITVCRDARTHSPSLTESLIKGIRSMGANVVDLGLAPTPIGYYSEIVGVPTDLTNGNDIDGAMIVTASHNPSQYNGMKMTFKNQSLNEEQIKIVKNYSIEAYKAQNPPRSEGVYLQYDIIPRYQQELKIAFSNLMQSGNITVVVDSGNGTGGVVAPNLYRDLGCKVIELFSAPDGRFPNHHPNPSDPKNLEDIKRAVIENKADLGIAFDGDSDRIGVVDSKGRQLTGDKLLLIYALDVIEKYKKANIKVKPVIVSEVKCSQVLYDTIDKMGGESVMCKTGHGYIKSMMKERNAILAGEMSGHTFFKDRYYGFDDAIYAGVRIIEIIARQKRNNPDFVIEDLLTPFDEVVTSPELRHPCPNELKTQVLEGFKQYVQEHPRCFVNEIKDIITLDGMRVVFDGGFALIRQSNTEPVFTCRFEGKTEQEVDAYRNVMVQKLDELIDQYSKVVQG